MLFCEGWHREWQSHPQTVLYKLLSAAFLLFIGFGFCINYFSTVKGYKQHIEVKQYPPAQNRPKAKAAYINKKRYELNTKGKAPLHLDLTTSTTTLDPNYVFEPPPPVNVDNFTVLIAPSRVCSENNVSKIVAYVYSTFKTYDRSVIRSTWADPSKYPSGLLQTFFVLGRPRKIDQEKLIEDDAEKNGDILYVDFQDSYENLTYKAVSAMKFILSRCNGVQYVVKADDDTVVNVPKVARTLMAYAPESLTLVCRMYWGSVIVRYPHKFYMDPKIYPVKRPDWYPPYCFGNGLSMTIGMLRKLYARVPIEPNMWIDDVYVTGILAEHIKENVTRHDLRVGTYTQQSFEMGPRDIDFAFTTFLISFSKMTNMMLVGYNKDGL